VARIVTAAFDVSAYFPSRRTTLSGSAIDEGACTT